MGLYTWQPIETVPDNKTVFLVVKGVCVSTGKPFIPLIGYFDQHRRDYFDQTAITDEYDDGQWMDGSYEPDFWMDILPTPEN